MGDLNFSFEIKYTENNVIKENGVLYIDAGEHNVITGMAIVSVPAYDESFALSLVAEEREDAIGEEAYEGVDKMNTEAEKNTEEVSIAETVESECKKQKMDEAEETDAQKKCKAEEAEAQKKCKAEETEAQKKCKAEEADAQKKCKSECDPEDEDEMDDEDCMSAECAKKKIAELESAVSESRDEAAAWEAKWAAINAEKETLYAQIAGLNAQIEELRAVEAEMNAIRAQKKADELAAKQEMAKTYAMKQGLDIAQEAVASAVESLDYTKIAELVMARDAEAEKKGVTFASYSAFEPMKITNRFEHVLKRVSD